jgi:hypothetical protein
MFDHTQSDSRIIARVSANVNTVFYKTATASRVARMLVDISAASTPDPLVKSLFL